MIGFELRCFNAVADADPDDSEVLTSGGYRGRASRSRGTTIGISKLLPTGLPLPFSSLLVIGVAMPIKSVLDVLDIGRHAISSKSERSKNLSVQSTLLRRPEYSLTIRWIPVMRARMA